MGDPWVLQTVRVENHDARNAADHADLGVTPTRGTPIKIDRRFVEADLRIATGLVEPHFMAGFSGGPKVVAPGIAQAETILLREQPITPLMFLESKNLVSKRVQGWRPNLLDRHLTRYLSLAP